jgi:chaperonin GroES
MATTIEKRTRLKPVGDKIIVEVLREATSTVSGIVLPDSAQEKSHRGKVIAIGSGKLLDNGQRAEPEVNPGDTVLFAKFGGSEVTLDGSEYMILSEREIHAVVEGKA